MNYFNQPWQVTDAVRRAAVDRVGDVDDAVILAAYRRYGGRPLRELDEEIEALVRELKHVDTPQPERWRDVRDMRIAAAVKRAYTVRRPS